MAIDTGQSNLYNPAFPIAGIDQPSEGFRLNFGIIKTAIENIQTVIPATDGAMNMTFSQMADGTLRSNIVFRNNAFVLPTGNPTGTIANGSIRYNNGKVDYRANAFWSEIVSTNLQGGVTIPGKTYLELPTGTTAERPAVARPGMMRQNSTTGLLEYYGSNGWVDKFPAAAHAHPISEVTGLQAALNAKLNIANPTFTGELKGPTATIAGEITGNSLKTGTGVISPSGNHTILKTGLSPNEKSWRFDANGDLYALNGTFRVGTNTVWHQGNFDPATKQDALGFTPANNTITLTAGNGLTGGGNLSANRTFTLGTPGAITLSSTNTVGASTHTHAFNPGGTTEQYIRGDGSLATMPIIEDGALNDVVRISETNLGKVGAGPIYTGTPNALWWANHPTGYSTMTNITTAGGAPINGFGYFFKLARRDTSNGWTGLYVNHSATDTQAIRFFVSRVYDGANLPRWAEVFTTDDTTLPRLSTSNTFTVPQTISTNGNISGENYGNGTVELNISSFVPRIGFIDKTTNAAHMLMAWNGSSTGTSLFSMRFDKDMNQTYQEDMFTIRRTSAGSYVATLGAYTLWTTQTFDPATKQDALGFTPANTNVSIIAGNGLSGGGTIAASRTLTLGTPGTLSGSTTNSVTATSHTHALSANLTTWDGLTPSTTSAINTVAQRTGAGDIVVRLLRSEHADTSTMSGGLVFRINSSSDNYLRTCNNPTSIRSWLGAGTVTSVAAGNGLVNGSITGSGTITLGTPESITGASGNTVSAQGHTHNLVTANAGNYRANNTTNPTSPNGLWDAAAFVNIASGTAINMSSGINFTFPMTSNRSMANPTNAKPGQSGAFYIQQDATGNRIMTAWPSNFKFPGGVKPTLSTAPNAVDVLFYSVINASFIVVNLIKGAA